MNDFKTHSVTIHCTEVLFVDSDSKIILRILSLLNLSRISLNSIGTDDDRRFDDDDDAVDFGMEPNFA